MLTQARLGVGRLGACRLGAFWASYALTIAGGDRRADLVDGSLTIRRALGTPGSCTCDVQAGAAPTTGQAIRVGLGSISNRLFSGVIQQVTYAPIGRRPRWHLTATDDTALLDRRKVIGRFTNTTADAIAIAILSTWTEGFTWRHVTIGLPAIALIEFTDEEVTRALTRIATAIGGYWFLDDDRDVWLFTDYPAIGTDPVAITVDHPTAQNLRYSVDLSQVRTRAIVEGGGGNTAVPVAAGDTRIPVTTAAWYSVLGGVARVGPNRVTYAGVDAGGAGALVGPGNAPTGAPSAVNSGGAALTAGALYHYALTFVTAAGETVPGPLGALTVPAGPISPPVITSAFDVRLYGSLTKGATYQWKVTALDGAGGETTPSAAATVVITNYYYSGSAEIAFWPAAGDPWAYGYRVYRTQANGSTFYLRWTLSAPGTYLDYAPDSDLNLAVQPPAVNTTVLQRAALTFATSAAAAVTKRRIYRTAGNGAQLKRLVEIADNTTTTYADAVADGALGVNAPTSDTSGLVDPTGQVAAGSTTLPVSDATPFVATGGWVAIGSAAVHYTGIAANALTGIPATGDGALASTVRHGTPIVRFPELTGIPVAGDGAVNAPIPAGTPANVVAIVDDQAAQAALAARLGEGDGVVEHTISDGRWNLETAAAVGAADLAIFSRGQAALEVTTRDILTAVGKLIAIALDPPADVADSLRIQTVDLEAMSGRAWPRYRVQASSVKFSFEDLLRRVKRDQG